MGRKFPEGIPNQIVVTQRFACTHVSICLQDYHSRCGRETSGHGRREVSGRYCRSGENSTFPSSSHPQRIPPLTLSPLTGFSRIWQLPSRPRSSPSYSRNLCEKITPLTSIYQLLYAWTFCLHPYVSIRVRNSNLGLCFFFFKCCVSPLFVDQISRNSVNF